MELKGIRYVTDENNRRIAVQIDLKKYGQIWEDFYEGLIAETRKDEEKIPLQQVIADIKAKKWTSAVARNPQPGDDHLKALRAALKWQES
jgi:hypothetical protein